MKKLFSAYRIVLSLMAFLFALPANAATTTQPSATRPAAPLAADPIRDKLQRAKDDYDAQVDSVKKRLLAYFSQRADAAQNRGDLTELKKFQTLKTDFETLGTLPANHPDLALRDNINNYVSATKLATINLTNAYTVAVREYTKAGRIPEAEVTQSELDTFQTGAPAATASTKADPLAPEKPPAPAAATPAAANGSGVGKWFVFSPESGIPKFFEPAPDAQLLKDGLAFPSSNFLRTTKSDFINNNFFFDVILTVDAKSIVEIGMGPHASGKAFAGVSINNGQVVAEAVGALGKLPSGTHFIHLEKKGSDFTSAVSLNFTNKYVADYSRTSDLRHDKYLTAENTHLFIATSPGVIIRQVRITLP